MIFKPEARVVEHSEVRPEDANFINFKIIKGVMITGRVKPAI